jgi:hypothetical protein
MNAETFSALKTTEEKVSYLQALLEANKICFSKFVILKSRVLSII